MELADFYGRLTICDPLSVADWAQSAMIALWAGDEERALKTAERGLKHNDGQEQLEIARINTMVAMGHLTKAEELYRARIRGDEETGQLAVLFAAVSGEVEKASILSSAWAEQFGANRREMIFFAAWIGDRESSNARAAAIDARDLGSSLLASIIFYCLCGAPFDLDATPNFRQRLNESGLAWPPPSPIEFPAKDW